MFGWQVIASRWDEDWAPALKTCVVGPHGGLRPGASGEESTIMRELRTKAWLPTRTGALLPARDCIVKGVKE